MTLSPYGEAGTASALAGQSCRVALCLAAVIRTNTPPPTGAAAGLEAGPVRLRAQLQPGRACFPKPSAAEPRPRQFDMQVVTVRSIVIGSQHRAKPLAGALVNGRQEPPHGSVVA